MPVYRQKMIYRKDLRSNPDVLYIFGDNLARTGLGGQAKEMRGEPNAVGIVTKVSPKIYMSDKYIDQAIIELDKDLKRISNHLKQGGKVIFPSDGIGTGLAKLQEKCPKYNKILAERLSALWHY